MRRCIEKSPITWISSGFVLSDPGPRPRMGRNSFSPDTPVWTADGQVPIGNLAVGDVVLGYNEATGATAPYTVTAVWAHEDPLVLAVTIDDEVITSTLEHPFYVMRRGWVAAEDLYPGQAVRRVDGSYGLVEAVMPVARHQPMVNLAEAHTFFVGDDGWLVHNARIPKSQLRRVGLPTKTCFKSA